MFVKTLLTLLRKLWFLWGGSGSEAKRTQSYPNMKKLQWTCMFCGKHIPDFSNLIRHVRTHTKEKSYSCSVWSTEFAQNSTLTIHSKLHSSQKRFSCEVCKKRFLRKQDIQVHLRVHSEDSPFKCEFCFKSFKTNYKLKSHITYWNSHFGKAVQVFHLWKVFSRKFFLAPPQHPSWRWEKIRMWNLR